VAQKAYPGWDLPIFVLEGLVTRQALVPGNLSGAKSVEMGQYMLKKSFDIFRTHLKPSLIHPVCALLN
jgi:hypothetical protein